ncbi:MAG: hypothetical protein J6P58_04490 [Oscillospiraceae bacterium]|nr:hypothetical protein [Oscillospiraceae bacterium]
MRKLTSLLLAAAVLLVMTACGLLTQPAATSAPAAEPAEETPEAASEPESEPEPAPGEGSLVEQPDLSNAPDAIDENQQALLEQFILIDELVQPGTAGSSLRAAVAAASLLDWAAKDQLSDEALAVVIDFMAAKSVEGQAEFGEKLDAVESTVELLTGKDSEQARDLLTDAGVIESCGVPWSKDAVAVIDRLMEALGRRAG